MSANGTWNTTINTPMGAQNGTLELNVDGSDLSGKMSSPQGEMAIENGAIDGDLVAVDDQRACERAHPNELRCATSRQSADIRREQFTRSAGSGGSVGQGAGVKIAVSTES